MNEMPFDSLQKVLPRHARVIYWATPTRRYPCVETSYMLYCKYSSLKVHSRPLLNKASFVNESSRLSLPWYDILEAKLGKEKLVQPRNASKLSCHAGPD